MLLVFKDWICYVHHTAASAGGDMDWDGFSFLSVVTELDLFGSLQQHQQLVLKLCGIFVRDSVFELFSFQTQIDRTQKHLSYWIP